MRKVVDITIVGNPVFWNRIIVTLTAGATTETFTYVVLPGQDLADVTTSIVALIAASSVFEVLSSTQGFITAGAIAYGVQDLTAATINFSVTNTAAGWGDEITIGRLFDDKRQRIYFFNWNGTGKHGIYVYDIASLLTTYIVIDTINTVGGVLLFDKAIKITQVDVMYGDSIQGDILYWVNCQGKACKVNVDKSFSVAIQNPFLDVIKAPPQIPPVVVYEDDPAATVNSLNKKLFKFKERFVYEDNDKSVWSAHSEMPIPAGYVDNEIGGIADPTKNCRIAITFQTGPANVKKIEIAAAENNGSVYGDFYQIKVLDKALLGIPDNDIFTYLFYNDASYVPIDVDESVQEFDYVPIKTEAQKIVNGNVVVYGGITEGYGNITTDVLAQLAGRGILTSFRPVVMMAEQSGNSGLGDGAIHIIFRGTVLPDNYAFFIQTTNETVLYVSSNGDTAEDVRDAVATQLTGLGFTVTDDGDNGLFAEKTGESLLVSAIDVLINKVTTNTQTVAFDFATSTFTITGAAGQVADYAASPILIFENATFPYWEGNSYKIVSATVVGGDLEVVVTGLPTGTDTGVFDADISIFPDGLVGLDGTQCFAYDWNSKYQYGEEYFDAEGRTQGVQTSDAHIFETGPYGDLTYSTIPEIAYSISHRPPEWAKYFHIVRSLNLTKSWFLYWISNATYKDSEYAYVSIEVLNQFILNNPSSAHLAYGFKSGDRIRFIKKLSGTYASYLTKDYEILNSVTGPYINGVLVEGQVLKISLPDTDATFDFGGTDFSNYLIQIYTPAKRVAEEKILFYEFGERYMIGDAGLPTRFHQGMIQNQSTDLADPALYLFSKGDNYYSRRELNVGNEATFSFDPQKYGDTMIGSTHALSAFLKMTLVKSYDVQDYVLSGQNFAEPAVAPAPSGNYFMKNANGTRSFSFKGQVKIKVDEYAQGDSSLISIRLSLSRQDGAYTPATLGAEVLGPFTPGQIIIIDFNQTGTIDDINNGTWSIINNSRNIGGVSPGYVEFSVVSGYLNLVELGSSYTVNVQSQHFSYYFPSAVNSNGRPWAQSPDAAQIFNPAMIRWGLAYQQDTNINKSNRFMPFNFDVIDRGKGTIKAFTVRQSMLRIFQETGVAYKGIYSQIVTNQQGQQSLVFSSEIFIKNNAGYYLEDYGVGQYPSGVASSAGADYFTDPIRGVQVRLAGNGMTAISMKYLGQFFIKSLILPYVKDRYLTDGTKADIVSVFLTGEDEVITFLQGDGSVAQNTFTFKEDSNAYRSFHDIYPEIAVSADDILYCFKAGRIYKHDNKSLYCNFFGVQYYPSVTPLFNRAINQKKTPLAMSYQANQTWQAYTPQQPDNPLADDIQTSHINPQTGLPQISSFQASNVEIKEDVRYVELQKDANASNDPTTALESLLDGDVLKGRWIKVKLTYQGTNFAWLFLPELKTIESQRNS